MNHIVIVTCYRDWDQFQLLISSLDRYLADACHIHVIWNEADDMPKILLEHHAYTVYARTQVIDWAQVTAASHDRAGGWQSQQLLKLFIWYQIQASYIVLDSKLCLMDTVTWPLLVAQAQRQDLCARGNFAPWINDICRARSWPASTLLLAPVTPYWMEHQVMSTMMDIFMADELVRLFMGALPPSEFQLHDCVRRNMTSIEYSGTYPNMVVFATKVYALLEFKKPQNRVVCIPHAHWQQLGGAYWSKHISRLQQRTSTWTRT